MIPLLFQTEASVAKSLFLNEAAKNTSMFDWRNFQNETIKRQFSKLAVANTANLPQDKITKVGRLSRQFFLFLFSFFKELYPSWVKYNVANDHFTL